MDGRELVMLLMDRDRVDSFSGGTGFDSVVRRSATSYHVGVSWVTLTFVRRRWRLLLRLCWGRDRSAIVIEVDSVQIRSVGDAIRGGRRFGKRFSLFCCGRRGGYGLFFLLLLRRRIVGVGGKGALCGGTRRLLGCRDGCRPLGEGSDFRSVDSIFELVLQRI